MSMNDLRAASVANRIAPIESHLVAPFCLVLLAASCALASFALACATPFAAFAVIAAAMLPLPSALIVVGAAWIVNQAIGFGWLHYPIDPSTIAWGFVIGLAALAATLASAIVLRVLSRTATPIVLAAAFFGAYGTYELALFAATPVLGGSGSFTAAIVGRLGLLNAVWLIGLVGVCEIIRYLNPMRSGRVVS